MVVVLLQEKTLMVSWQILIMLTVLSAPTLFGETDSTTGVWKWKDIQVHTAQQD